MTARPVRATSVEGLAIVGELRGRGDAPLVLLLHGGGQTRHAWTGTADHLLGAGFDVGSYDARGHGDSDWAADRDYSLPAHGRDLVAFLRAAGRPAALVGASMGGISALFAAAEAPELVRALVLVDIVPRFAPEGVARVRNFMQAHPDGFATIEDAAAAVHAYNPNRARSKNPSGLMRSLREGADGRLRWHWDPAVVGDAPTEALADMLSERLAALPASLPLMLISGAQSDVVDPQAVAGFRAQAPHAEIVAVDRAGHMVAGDRNDAFSDAIAGFLRRRLAPPS